EWQHGVRLFAEGQFRLAVAVEHARGRRSLHAVTEKCRVRLSVAVEVADGQERPVLLRWQLHRWRPGELAVRTAVELPVGREQVVAKQAEVDVRPVDLGDEFAEVWLRRGQVEGIEPAKAARDQRRPLVHKPQVVRVPEVERNDGERGERALQSRLAFWW